MKPFRHVLLLGNGETLPNRFLQQLAQRADCIIATDAAADRALSAAIEPDIIIGDLDSVSAAAKRRLVRAQWIQIPRQDNTDLEKALDWLLSQACTHCTLCGFFGGRIDFTFGNFLSLAPYVNKIQLAVCGPGWHLRPVTRRLSIPCSPAKRVSLLPVTTCRKVRSCGLKYPLNNETVSPKYPGRYISNQTTAKRFSVTLENGLLWVYWED